LYATFSGGTAKIVSPRQITPPPFYHRHFFDVADEPLTPLTPQAAGYAAARLPRAPPLIIATSIYCYPPAMLFLMPRLSPTPEPPTLHYAAIFFC